MPCFHPLTAYRIVRSGAVEFNRPAVAHLDLKLPCGRCEGCRLERSRQWAMRCMHEAALYEDNCFITLTYDDEHLPPFGSLDGPTDDKPGAFALFMKRLRKSIEPRRVRYYHCGEYGSSFGRPHYHALLFGFDFADKALWNIRNGIPVFRSAALEALWPQGHSEIGTVTFESAAYVARYVLKREAKPYYQVCDGETGELAIREREYCTMSRRPGIGRGWLDKYMGEVYAYDSIVVRGAVSKPPRYYDSVYESIAPEEMEKLRELRLMRRKPSEETPERLEAREICARARVSLARRGYEATDGSGA